MSNHKSLIVHAFSGEVISMRAKDGYINATALCTAAGKKFHDYGRLDTTRAFISALAAKTGIPDLEIIQVVRNVVPEQRGTWVHPHVAINLAQWLSPEFAVQVSEWVQEWFERGRKADLPFHIRRHLMNVHNIPAGHFSILSEMAITLIADLEISGYILPEKLWPDISEGKIFAGWLRKKGVDTSDIRTYWHVFEDGRPSIQARAYPDRYLPAFRKHLREVWIPKRAAKYFAERDPEAIPYLERRYALEAPETRTAVIKKASGDE